MGSMVLVISSVYPCGLSLYSGAMACAPKNVNTKSIGLSSFNANKALSKRNSVEIFKPYPVLVSAVVVPFLNIRSKRGRVCAINVSRLAVRVALTVERIPPPAARMSRYGVPAIFFSNSSARSPAQMTCVCGSTKPGMTTQRPASRVGSSG